MLKDTAGSLVDALEEKGFVTATSYFVRRLSEGLEARVYSRGAREVIIFNEDESKARLIASIVFNPAARIVELVNEFEQALALSGKNAALDGVAEVPPFTLSRLKEL